LLLDHLGLEPAAKAVRDAVARILKAGNPRTPDLGGKASTADLGSAVLEAV
jgi:isocitrate/isopropylmalate dehydrogenase